MLDRIRVIENQWPYHATKCMLAVCLIQRKSQRTAGQETGGMHLVSSDVWDIIRRTRQACYRKTFRRHNNTFMRVRTHFYWYTLFYWYTHFRFYLRFFERILSKVARGMHNRSIAFDIVLAMWWFFWRQGSVFVIVQYLIVLIMLLWYWEYLQKGWRLFILMTRVSLKLCHSSAPL